jgi:hypothetical protein
MIHECFHAYQATLAQQKFYLSERVIGNYWNQYPWENEDDKLLFKNSVNILYKAYETDIRKDVQQFLHEYSLLQTERLSYQYHDSVSINLEQNKEWEEGLGKYTEIQIYHLADKSTTYAPLESLKNVIDFNSYKKFTQKWK